MPRLTAELIERSLSYNNPLHERELNLRGHQIAQIENLGVAKDHDSIDLTDNHLSTLSNFPLFPRLRTLLLARNRIATISPTIRRSLPGLNTLVLDGNRIAELSDLDTLTGLKYLEHLVLIGNPVASKENYRLYILHRNPSVRFLDYAKVKDAERSKAKQLYGTPEKPTNAARDVSSSRSKAAIDFNSSNDETMAGDLSIDVSVPGNAPDIPARAEAQVSGVERMNLTDAEKKVIVRRIRNATSMKEVEMLDKALSEGKLSQKLRREIEAEGQGEISMAGT